MALLIAIFFAALGTCSVPSHPASEPGARPAEPSAAVDVNGVDTAHTGTLFGSQGAEEECGTHGICLPPYGLVMRFAVLFYCSQGWLSSS